MHPNSGAIVHFFKEEIMLSLQHIIYTHPNKDLLFDDLNLVVNKHEKIALASNNGIGKSTLLNIMAGHLSPQSGIVKADAKPYYIPQIFGQYNEYTIARALRIDHQLHALQEILNGHVTEENLNLLDDDWSVEERCYAALDHWELGNLSLNRKMGTLSGGQKTKVFLSGIDIHQPEIVLLDELSNHLDAGSRALLYNYIQTTDDTLVVVSHDRMLMNLLTIVYELSKKGITIYGGNYDFYKSQKAIEADALNEDVKNHEKALRKAKETERESIERQQKLDARGRKKQEKSGLPTISMNTLRNNAEKSTARMKDIHAGKTGALSQELSQLRKTLPDKDRMKIGFDDAALHQGKMLINAQRINYSYGDQLLWKSPLSFQIVSGQRIAIKGNNGSGKTTLIRLLLGELKPSLGAIALAVTRAIYIDQEYSLIDDRLTVYEQALQYNTAHLEEHEVKSLLTRFLFTKAWWDKPGAALSGGEKMRLILCCLTIGGEAPDLIVLDEPTNNLDIQNIEILTDAIIAYSGTLVVISHDAYFLDQIGVEEVIELVTDK